MARPNKRSSSSATRCFKPLNQKRLLRAGALSQKENWRIASPAPHNPSWADLPIIARELIDMEPYRAAWTAAHGHFSTNVGASRAVPSAATGALSQYRAAASDFANLRRSRRNCIS